MVLDALTRSADLMDRSSLFGLMVCPLAVCGLITPQRFAIPVEATPGSLARIARSKLGFSAILAFFFYTGLVDLPSDPLRCPRVTPDKEDVMAWST